jgi:hypothetical protein
MAPPEVIACPTETAALLERFRTVPALTVLAAVIEAASTFTRVPALTGPENVEAPPAIRLRLVPAARPAKDADPPAFTVTAPVADAFPVALVLPELVRASEPPEFKPAAEITPPEVRFIAPVDDVRPVAVRLPVMIAVSEPVTAVGPVKVASEPALMVRFPPPVSPAWWA